MSAGDECAVWALLYTAANPSLSQQLTLWVQLHRAPHGVSRAS